MHCNDMLKREYCISLNNLQWLLFISAWRKCGIYYQLLTTLCSYYSRGEYYLMCRIYYKEIWGINYFKMHFLTNRVNGYHSLEPLMVPSQLHLELAREGVREVLELSVEILSSKIVCISRFFFLPIHS